MCLVRANISVPDSLCPHYDFEVNECNAVCKELEIDFWMKTKYCANEDYAYCSVFAINKLRLRK